jgi:predicted ABC-type ATPase
VVDNGYDATLLYFYLDSIKLAQERVQTRVFEGVHSIPDDVIKDDISKEFRIYLIYTFR